MDYRKHYNLLIERGKNRVLDCYTENHHIKPKCMHGSDDFENLVRLTPEEHYVAHQLLVKMYPDHSGLIDAARMMTVSSETCDRSKNKMFGWLKRRYHEICKQRIGEKNGSFGSFWITNGIENRKIKSEKIPEGWWKGANWFKTKEEYFERLRRDNLSVEEKKKENFEQYRFKNEKQYEEFYDLYSKLGWVEFQKITNYSKTQQNLVIQFKRYVKNYKPQRGNPRNKDA